MHLFERSLLLTALVSAFVAALGGISTPAQAQSIKNVQDVLGGKLTRAGNTQQAQLSDSELVSLCESGYTTAYFLYSGATERSVSCSHGSIHYRSQSLSDVSPILQDVYGNIKAGSGKTFVHCNNGAHASGLVAALALRQFCDYGSDSAFNYWDSTLNGYEAPNVPAIRRRIDTFTPSQSMSLTAQEKAQLGCR